MIELIAHRGASRERLENTLPAFQRALDLGADAVELDVHCTVDGAVVVHHDPVLRGTPEDHALLGLPIAALTAAQVRTVRLDDGSTAPTLAEVATLLGNRAALYCELKGRGTASAALAILAQYGGPCAVHAFDHRQVADAFAASPGVARGVLEVSRHVDPASTPRSAHARDLWQLVEYIDEALVRDVHAAGMRVIAWTANAPDVIEQLARWRVDALCTDDIALARQVLGR